MPEPNLTASDLGLSKLNDWMDSNFWTRPEGKVAKVVLMGIALMVAGGIIFSLPSILAYILAVLQTATQIAIHAAGLGLAYFAITSKKLRSLVGMAFRTGIRKLTSIFVNMAPVAVARDIIRTSWKNIEKAVEAIKSFKAQMIIISQQVAEFEKRAEEQSAGAKQFLRKGNRDQAEMLQAASEKTKQRANNLKAMYQKMEVVSRTLEQMYAKAKIKLKNAQNDLEDQIKMRETMMEGQRAIRALKSAVMGNADQNEMFDMAVTRIALDVANAVVEIDDFVNMGAELFESVDLEEAKFGERALSQIEKWERESHSSVLGPGEKQSLIDAAINPAQPYDLEQINHGRATVTNKVDISDFFSN